MWNSCTVFVILSVISGYFCQNNITKNTCILPDNSSGICVALDQCPEIKNILRDFSKSRSQNATEYIQKLKCNKINNEIAVCCKNPENSTSTSIHKNLRLLPPNCGQSHDNRVAGGKVAELFEFPWMALIRYETRNGLENLCGGSIINDRYILTAAHCILRPVYSVVLGDFNTTSEEDCVTRLGERICLPPREEYFIEELIPHPEYNRPRKANDIGLIRLNKSISFAQDHIKPVCLPQTEELQKLNLTKLVVIGWGLTEQQKLSDVPMKATLRVTAIDECAQLLRVALSDNQICAKGTGITDSCEGDSGGPLILPSTFNGIRYVQYGIVSFGPPGCGKGQGNGAVYVRVQNYMTWILDNLKSDNPETDNSETDNPETDNTATDNPETDNPETDNPETVNRIGSAGNQFRGLFKIIILVFIILNYMNDFQLMFTNKLSFI